MNRWFVGGNPATHAHEITHGAFGLTGGGASGAVTLSIAAGGVGTTQLADNAVATTKILDGAVTTTKLADGAVATAKLVDGAVTTAKIAANAVGTNQIAANGVTTSDIAAGAVTMSKIAVPVGYAAAVQAGSAVVYASQNINFTELGDCLVTADAVFATTSNTSIGGFQVKPIMVHSTNASVEQAEYGFSAPISSGATTGRQATATALLSTNQTGNWRFACRFVNAGTNPIECRVSWLCN